jgi:hypothetical protein
MNLTKSVTVIQWRIKATPIEVAMNSLLRSESTTKIFGASIFLQQHRENFHHRRKFSSSYFTTKKFFWLNLKDTGDFFFLDKGYLYTKITIWIINIFSQKSEYNKFLLLLSMGNLLFFMMVKKLICFFEFFLMFWIIWPI